MQKHFLTSLMIGGLMLAPALAAASSIDDVQTQLKYVLARFVALSADEPVSCAVVASKTSVRVGEQFTLLWFSTGMNRQAAHDGVKLDPFGVYTVAIDKPGKKEYKFNFYDASGNPASCSVQLTVSA